MRLLALCFTLLFIGGCATQPVLTTQQRYAQAVEPLKQTDLKDLTVPVYALLEKQKRGYRFTHYSAGVPGDSGMWVNLRNGHAMWAPKPQRCRKSMLTVKAPEITCETLEPDENLERFIRLQKYSKCKDPKIGCIHPARRAFLYVLIWPVWPVMGPILIANGAEYDLQLDQDRYQAAVDEALSHSLKHGDFHQAPIASLNRSVQQILDIQKNYHITTRHHEYQQAGLQWQNPDDAPSFYGMDLWSVTAPSLSALATQLTPLADRYQAVALRFDHMREQIKAKQAADAEKRRLQLAAEEKERQRLAAIRRLDAYKQSFKGANTAKKIHAFIRRYQQEGYDPLNYLAKAEQRYQQLREQEAKQRRHEQLKGMGDALQKTLKGVSQ